MLPPREGLKASRQPARVMESLWPWLAVAGLGALHGLNPATGWMLAAAWGVRSGDRGHALRALVPIALEGRRGRGDGPRPAGAIQEIDEKLTEAFELIRSSGHADAMAAIESLLAKVREESRAPGGGRHRK